MPLAAAVALFLFGGCATVKGAGMVARGAAPREQGFCWRTGVVALLPDPKPAQFGFDKAAGQIGYGAEAAGAAAGSLLATSAPEPLLDLPVEAGTLVLAPFAALKGAIGARKNLSADKLSECETKLIKAMNEMAAQQRFHDWLLKVASEECPNRLVPALQTQPADRETPFPDSALEARVEELWLERTGSRDTSFQLRVKTRTRLVRIADGAVLYDQPAEYRSGKCLFMDWTRRDGLQSVADTAYRFLAEQCVSRLLTTTDQPTLAGAGYRRTPAPKPRAEVTLASSRRLAGRGPAQLVGYPMTDTGTLGIYSTGSVAHVVIQCPLTREEAVSEALDDVDYMFDGLNQHPNLLVAVPAAVSATPISLWKQGAALVRGRSPRTVQKAQAELAEAAHQTRPHQELALELAQQLAPRASQPVMLVRQPLPPGAEDDPALVQCAARGTLACLTGGQTAGGYLLSQGADTALEIHVQSAALAGNGGVNPKLALCVEARATLLRARDGLRLYSCPVRYRSQGRTFTAWAARDAKLFREELRKCYRDLGAVMADQLVARGLVPPDPRPQPTLAGK